jgi:hypothetical protein
VSESKYHIKLSELKLPLPDKNELLGIEEFRLNLHGGLIGKGSSVQDFFLIMLALLNRIIEHPVKLVIILYQQFEDLHVLCAKNTISSCYRTCEIYIQIYNSYFALTKGK